MIPLPPVGLDLQGKVTRIQERGTECWLILSLTQTGNQGDSSRERATTLLPSPCPPSTSQDNSMGMHKSVAQEERVGDLGGCELPTWVLGTGNSALRKCRAGSSPEPRPRQPVKSSLTASGDSEDRAVEEPAGTENRDWDPGSKSSDTNEQTSFSFNIPKSHDGFKQLF